MGTEEHMWGKGGLKCEREGLSVVCAPKCDRRGHQAIRRVSPPRRHSCGEADPPASP